MRWAGARSEEQEQEQEQVLPERWQEGAGEAVVEVGPLVAPGLEHGLQEGVHRLGGARAALATLGACREDKGDPFKAWLANSV